MMHEGVALNLNVALQRLNVVVQQLLPQRRGQVGLGVIQERCNVIMQRAFASALVVQKEWLLLKQHHIA
jgi:hypothetical protein